MILMWPISVRDGKHIVIYWSSVCLLSVDAQDKALIFQADAKTSLLGAIRQVTGPVPCNHILTYSRHTLCIKALTQQCKSATVTSLDASCASHAAKYYLPMHKSIVRFAVPVCPIPYTGTWEVYSQQPDRGSCFWQGHVPEELHICKSGWSTPRGCF